MTMKPWLIVTSDDPWAAEILAECDTHEEAENSQTGGYIMESKRWYAAHSHTGMWAKRFVEETVEREQRKRYMAALLEILKRHDEGEDRPTCDCSTCQIAKKALEA